MKIRNISPILTIENKHRSILLSHREQEQLRMKKKVLEEIARVAGSEEQRKTARRYLSRIKEVLDRVRELGKGSSLER